MEDYSRLFVDSSEVKLGILGGNYISNFIATGMIDKGFCVVSNKRVYFKGKCFHKVGDNIKSTKEERTVDLSDVTGNGFSESRFFILKILAILSLVYAVGCCIMALASGEMDNFENIFWCIIICGISPAVIFCAIYWFTKIKLFEVSFAGGKIAFKASNYNKNEMQEFQKTLRKAKDQYINDRNMQSAYIASALQNHPNQSVQPQTSSNVSVADEIMKYKTLLDSGVISQQEFEEMKKRVLER